MLKAAIPYVGSSFQRSMAFLEKYMELTRTISLFQDPEPSIQMCALPEDNDSSPRKLLDVLREFCTEKEQETVDTLLQCIQVFSNYGTLFP